MTGCGWLWLYFGAFLMLLELATPGFVLFFFGLAAVTVGLLRFAAGDAFTLAWQLASFSAFAILYLAVLRRLLKKLFMGASEEAKLDFDHEHIGRIGKVTAAIAPPLAGRAEIGDAEWTVTAEAPIAAGATVKVVSQHNLTMKVEEVK